MNLTSSTNLSSAHFEAHKNFIGGAIGVDCSYIMSIQDIDERCQFSKHHGCHATDVFIDYVTIFFCHIPGKTGESAGIISYFTLLVISLGVVVLLILNSFSCFAHNVIAIVALLKLDEHTGGAIVVALLNGAADSMGRFSRPEGDLELVTNEMFGTALLLILFHAGLLLTIFPLTIRRSFFLRDHFISLVYFAFVNLCIHFTPVHVVQGVALSVLYLLFVVISITHYILAKRKEEKEGEIAPPVGKHTPQLSKLGPISISYNDEPEFGEGSSPNDQLFKQFLRTLNPIKKHEMENAHVVKKAFLILTSPLRVVFILVLPCVNYSLPGHGWSKLMNCINLVLTPLTVAGAYKPKFVWFYGCLLIPGLILAPIVFFTSRTDRPPKYHPLFAFYGAFGSVCITFLFASELLSMWDLLAVIAGIDPAITFITVFAWGNTIGDVVLNLTLASYGFSYMAFAAYLYCPLLNVLFNCGLMMLTVFIYNGITEVSFREGDEGVTARVFVFIALCSTIIAASLSEYKLRRSMGCFMMITYLIFLIYIGLSAIHFIHEYGTDHLIEEGNKHDATWA